MKDIMPELDSEMILLMYLADELSPRHRAQVERTLESDEQLRQQLEQLRETMHVVDEAMKIDDIAIDARADRCAERTIAAMHRWQAKPRPLRQVQEPVGDKLPLPWWSYPFAAAASVLVAAAVYFANIEPRNITQPTAPVMAQSVPDLLASPVLGDLRYELLMDPYTQYAMAEDLAASFDESQTIFNAILSDSELLRARQEISVIQELSQDAFASVDWRW